MTSVLHGPVDGAGLPDSTGEVLLHGPAHAAEGSTVVPAEYAAGGTALVVLLGGLLFQYYERRAEPR